METGGADIEANFGGKICRLECTFKHTSNKLESLFWRFDSACGRNFAKKPFLISNQFRFPNAENIRELSPELYKATKMFITTVYKAPERAHAGIFEDFCFEFNPVLSPVMITIDSQHDATSSLAKDFFHGSLARLIENKAK